MYRDHFGLTADPFNNTPDPRFFFNTPNHEEALASLLYTATMRKGFALVTGEVGSGKTLLTRLAIGRLPVGTQTAVITNTRLTGPELLVAVCREFQLRADHTSSPAELTHTLEQFLLEQYARDRLCVVILDEAQNLSPDAFEELRLLGNLEAEDAKLLQILILGQPELQETFRRSDLRQLRQRMFRVFHLGGLSEEQTLGYIRHRIDVAGGQADALFDAPAITAIHRASRGLPRIINQLADNCLLHAYSSGATRITAQTVQACIDVVEIDAPLTAAAEPAATPPTAATPRRAAAPTVDGRAARHSARTAAVATTDIIAAETERAGTAIAATVSAESLAAVDAVVERLGERLSNFERRIDTIALQLKTPRETAEQVESDLARIRNARHQAQEMLEDARGRLDAMTARFGEVTLQGEADLRMLADRTGQTLRHAEDQTQEVARRADRLRSEVLAQRDAQLKQIVAADATAALDAGELRRQIETATADMRRVTEATNDRLDEMWKLLGTDLATTRSELAELRKRSDARAAAALDAERIAAEAKARVEETIRQAEQRVEQLRQQIEALPRAESAAHAASLAAAQAARARVAELVASAEGLCATAQAQINDTVNDLHRTVATQVAAAQREAQQPLDESRRALGDFESAVAAARAEAQRVRSELDAAVERARATVAQTTQQFAATLDGHRADVADLQRAATTVHGELSQRCDQARREALAQLEAQSAAIAEVKRDLHADAQATRGAARAALAELAREFETARTRAAREAEALLAGVDDRLAQSDRMADGLRERLAASLAAAAEQASAAEAQMKLHADDVAAQLSKLTEASLARITSANELAKNSVAELSVKSEHVRGVWRVELAEHQRELTTSVEAIRREAATIRETFDALRGQLESELDTAGRTIAAQRDHARAAAERMIESLDGLIRRAAGQADAVEQRINRLLTDGQERSEKLSVFADEVSSRTTALLASLSDQADELQARFDTDIGRIRDELATQIATHREQVETLERQVAGVGPAARAATDELAERLGALRTQATRDAETLAGGFSRIVCETQASAAKLRTELEGVQRHLVTTADTARREMDEAAARRAAAAEQLRRQATDALSSVREEIERMTRMSETLRSEISTGSEDIRRAVDSADRRLQQRATATAGAVDALRESAKRDAEAAGTRLDALRQQVEGVLDQVRTQAGKLLEQAQTGGETLRSRAEEILVAAQSGAEGIAQHAESLLRGATESADRLRAEAEELLRRTEESTRTVRSDVQSLRAELQLDREKFETQAARTHAESLTGRDQAEHLLARAEEVERRTRELVAMPARLVAEADQRASELRDMTHAVAKVISKLSEAQQHAVKQARQIEAANATAEQRLGQISQHTVRVGQLVGIIRQLYGAMDARVEKMRARLSMADDLCRSVPREIEGLREVLSERVGRLESVPVEAEPVAVGAPVPAGPKSAAPKAAAPRPAAPRRVVKPAVTAPNTPKGPSLGEVVSKNAQLAAWLRDTLSDADSTDKRGQP